jgi:hypothetical protein
VALAMRFALHHDLHFLDTGYLHQSFTPGARIWARPPTACRTLHHPSFTPSFTPHLLYRDHPLHPIVCTTILYTSSFALSSFTPHLCTILYTSSLHHPLHLIFAPSFTPGVRTGTRPTGTTSSPTSSTGTGPRSRCLGPAPVPPKTGRWAADAPSRGGLRHRRRRAETAPAAGRHRDRPRGGPPGPAGAAPRAEPAPRAPPRLPAPAPPLKRGRGRSPLGCHLLFCFHRHTFLQPIVLERCQETRQDLVFGLSMTCQRPEPNLKYNLP